MIHAPRLGSLDIDPVFRKFPLMSESFDVRGRLILRLLREGMDYLDTAATLRISRMTIYYRIRNNPTFAEAVAEAREEGREIRERRHWFQHYRRGMRPPTGKGHGGKPRFSVKRR